MRVMQTKSLKSISLCLLLISFLFPSCVDNSYDLDGEMDLTIEVGGESLALPFGSTEKVFLRKFLKVEDAELLDTLATGEYWLTKEADITETTISVDPVTLEGYDVLFGGWTILQPTTTTYPSEVVNIPITGLDANESFNLDQQEVPEEIKSIYYIELGTKQEPAVAQLSFKLTGPSGVIGEINLNGMQLRLPEYIILDQSTPGVSGSTYTFSEQDQFTAGEEFALKLTIKGIDFVAGGNNVQFANGRLTIGGEIYLGGSLNLLNVNLSEGIEEEIALIPTVTFPSYSINKISGQFQPEINIESTMVELEGIPDFLQDDDVRLDLTNPRICFRINNPADLPVNVSADLTGYKKEQKTKKISIGGDTNPIIIPAQQASEIILSVKGGVNTGNIIHVAVPNMNSLIEIIPDYIMIDLYAEADQNEKHALELGRDYEVKMDYLFDMPLAFGANMHIVYKDTMDGWNEDIKDYELSHIEIKADIVNSIPLSLALIGEAVDVNGNLLPAVKVEIDSDIPSCKNDDTPSTQPVTITLTAESEAISKLDGIILKVTADVGEATNIPLKSSQYFRLENMRAKVRNGIQIDLN